MVVYGQDGMDEISLSAPTTVCEVRNGNFKSYVITPEQFGFKRCKKEIVRKIVLLKYNVDLYI